jgi:hypothetical protein
MKRAKSRVGKNTSRVCSRRTSVKPVDLAAIREEIRNLVGNAAAEMVEHGIEEANKGHYSAMKFLFELVGLYPAGEGVEQNPEEDGLAKALFSRLGVMGPGSEVTNDCGGTAAAGGDAVE